MSRARTALRVAFAAAVTSPRLRAVRSAWHGLWRGREVHYFHEEGDPYSALTATVLPSLRRHYQIHLTEHDVSSPPVSLAPDRARLYDWAWRDAEYWRQVTGCLPTPLQGATVRFAAETTPRTLAGDRLRARLGGFLGASFWFRGEWFWGLDRLPLLLRRLEAANLTRTAPWRDYPRRPPPLPVERAATVAGNPPGLEFWCSLRSPYTYLAVPRIRAWAETGRVELQLRPLLPMVMRGLPVPWVKRRYILRDAGREAEELGLPFGHIADPVGRPTERGLAVLYRVQSTRGTLAALVFMESFLRGVFAEGIDARTDAGLRTLAGRAGVDWPEVTAALNDDRWRAEVAANREALLAAGLWGVPSFRLAGHPAQWGQDRLWVIERQLQGYA